MIVDIAFISKGCDKLIEYVPDNYDAFITYEREQKRIERLHKKQEIKEEIENEELPFYEESEDI